MTVSVLGHACVHDIFLRHMVLNAAQVVCTAPIVCDFKSMSFSALARTSGCNLARCSIFLAVLTTFSVSRFHRTHEAKRVVQCSYGSWKVLIWSSGMRRLSGVRSENDSAGLERKFDKILY